MSTYHTRSKIHAILKSAKVSCYIVPLGVHASPWKAENVIRVSSYAATLVRPEQNAAVLVRYHQGLGVKNPPTACDIVASLLLDASCGYDTLQEYIDEMGAPTFTHNAYTEAKKMWKACKRAKRDVYRLFFGVDIAELETLCQEL